LYTRTGIINLIEQYAPFEKIKSSSISGYACAYNISKSDVDYFHLNSIKDKEEFVNVLLASSAIPIVYNSIIIKGNPYLDGGLKDNVPTYPILKEGIDKIIIIIFKEKDMQLFIPNSTKRIVVFPNKDIDATVNGVLDFDPKNAEYRMEIGYQSGIKILKNWKEKLEI
jgi:NTE family protein